VNEVTRQAEKNPEIKTLALKDPHAAVKKVTGKDLPPGINLRLVEQPNEAIALHGSEALLSDAQFDAVAGGALSATRSRTNIHWCHVHQVPGGHPRVVRPG
jgi:hypothetical protein